MPQTLQITDGTTTLDLTGSNYKLLSDGGWSPKRAQRRISPLGGRSIYEDVEEQLYIQVAGSSASDTWSKYDDLSNLLDQAERWGRGENVNAVLIKYSPSGSSTDVQAVITGPPQSGSFLQQPSNADFTANTNLKIGLSGSPIVMRFMRRGLWLSTASESKVAPASTGNPDIVALASYTTSASIPSPTDITVAYGATGIFLSSELFVISADNTNKLWWDEAENADVAGPGGRISVISTGIASGGSSVLYRATSVADKYNSVLSWNAGQLSAFNSTANLIAFYLSIRNRSTAGVPNSFMLRASIGGKINGPGVVVTETEGPKILPLGMIPLPTNFTSVYGIEIQASSIATNSSTAANALELDYVTAHSVDEQVFVYKNNGYSSVLDDLYIKPRLNSHLEPDSYIDTNSSTRQEIAYLGDASPYHLGQGGGAILFGISYGVTAGEPTGFQTMFMPFNGQVTAANITLTSDRTLAFLTPQ